MWRVIYQPAALKALRRMDARTADRIMTKISALAVDPLAPNANAKKLRGVDGYRLRVGDWRVIYALRHDVLTVAVVKIASRGSVYE